MTSGPVRAILGENETLKSEISDDEPDNPRTLAGFADPDPQAKGRASEEYFGEDEPGTGGAVTTCPTCRSGVRCTVVNISLQPSDFAYEFCLYCAPVVCPTFHPAAVISVEEAAWLRAQGIDPGTSQAEEYVRKLGLERV
jgi:hypothetical protein